MDRSNPDGSSEPETFENAAEAEAVLNELLGDIPAEIDTGHRAESEGHSRDNFRIVEAGAH